MGSVRAKVDSQCLPNELLCSVMELLPPDDQRNMMLANKALRQHFVATMKPAIDRAFAVREAANKALTSDTWQWEVAVRKQPKEDCFTHDFEKLHGHQPSCKPPICGYRFHLVMTQKSRCVEKATRSTHSDHAGGAQPHALRGVESRRLETPCHVGSRSIIPPACLGQPRWHSTPELLRRSRSPAAGPEMCQQQIGAMTGQH